MKLEFGSLEELRTFAAAIGWFNETEAPKPAPEPKAKKKTEKAEKPEPTPEPEVEVVPEVEPEVDYKALRKQILEHVQKTYNDSNIHELATALKKVGYARITLVPDEKLNDLWELIKGD